MMLQLAIYWDMRDGNCRYFTLQKLSIFIIRHASEDTCMTFIEHMDVNGHGIAFIGA